MTHTATRIQPGVYHYRGYEIEDMKRHNEGLEFWNIRHLDEESAHDAESTLRQSKAIIDWWEASK